MENLKTHLHTYSFDTSKSDQREEYAQLCYLLETTPGRGRWMHSIAMPNERRQEARDVELEPAHTFSNQWNTADGHRVFDWYEGIYPNKHYRAGHYLDITPEMVAHRQNQLVCGYCGARSYQTDGAVVGSFCGKCLDSPYLKESDLCLLRLRPVAEGRPKRAPLTDDERAELLPRYVERQTTGADSRNAQRLAKQRAGIVQKRDAAIRNATHEHDGMLWLMDHGVSIDNCIFYSHTGRFGFGWRSPVDQAVYSALVDVLCEFPFDYDIKKAEGVQ